MQLEPTFLSPSKETAGRFLDQVTAGRFHDQVTTVSLQILSSILLLILPLNF